EEKQNVANGADVDVWLEIKDISESVSAEDKAKIAEVLGNGTVGVYLDVSMFKQVGQNDAVRIESLNGKVKITLKIPESLINTDKSVTRKYGIIRIHDGKAESIIPVYDEKVQTLTFETDRFSTYVITYTDIAAETDLPETGVKNYIWLWTTIAVISGGILIAIPVVLLKKKKDEKDK
ncbi:MAG: hypothetical protein II350_08695, partial [Clostridia bacterium]|nr:hypothetical protein [Clostridia bacterium]